MGTRANGEGIKLPCTKGQGAVVEVMSDGLRVIKHRTHGHTHTDFYSWQRLRESYLRLMGNGDKGVSVVLPEVLAEREEAGEPKTF